MPTKPKIDFISHLSHLMLYYCKQDKNKKTTCVDKVIKQIKVVVLVSVESFMFHNPHSIAQCSTYLIASCNKVKSIRKKMHYSRNQCLCCMNVQGRPGGAQSSSPGGPSSASPAGRPGRGMSVSAIPMSTPMGSSGSGMLSVSPPGVAVEIPNVVIGTPILASLAVRFFCMCCCAAAIIALMSIGWGFGFLKPYSSN